KSANRAVSLSPRFIHSICMRTIIDLDIGNVLAFCETRGVDYMLDAVKRPRSPMGASVADAYRRAEANASPGATRRTQAVAPRRPQGCYRCRLRTLRTQAGCQLHGRWSEYPRLVLPSTL